MAQEDLTHTRSAQRMLDSFSSVGAQRFYVTKTNVREDKTRAWPTTCERLREVLPAVLRAAAVRKPCMIDNHTSIMAGENVIVRPLSDTTAFIQLDDLSAEAIERVRPAAFLILATSPGNHQAWIAVSGLKGQAGEEEVNDLVRRVKKDVGDKSASGAARLAGTENFKLKYAPEFPRVAIIEVTPGKLVAQEELERLGLVSPPEPTKQPLIPFRASGNRGRKTWPSYEHSLARAPAARNHEGPDRSMADFVWCMTAIDWGFGIKATAEQLLKESAKARDKGRDYALETARNAHEEVEKNRAGVGRGRG